MIENEYGLKRRDRAKVNFDSNLNFRLCLQHSFKMCWVCSLVPSAICLCVRSISIFLRLFLVSQDQHVCEQRQWQYEYGKFLYCSMDFSWNHKKLCVSFACHFTFSCSLIRSTSRYSIPLSYSLSFHAKKNVAYLFRGWTMANPNRYFYSVGEMPIKYQNQHRHRRRSSVHCVRRSWVMTFSLDFRYPSWSTHTYSHAHTFWFWFLHAHSHWTRLYIAYMNLALQEYHSFVMRWS